MKTAILTAAIAAGLFVGNAQADGFGRGGPMGAGMMDPGMMPDFATLDADGDGLVTAQELQAQAGARFAAADTDGDGGISAAEMVAQAEQMRAAMAERRMARMIAAMDENGDGLLQQDEMQHTGPGLAMMLDRLDRDGDGAISADEFDAMAARMNDRRGNDDDDDDDGWGWRRGHHGDGWGWGHGDRDGRRNRG